MALLFHCFSKVYSPLRLELVVTDGQLVELLSAMEITSQLYQIACTLVLKLMPAPQTFGGGSTPKCLQENLLQCFAASSASQFKPSRGHAFIVRNIYTRPPIGHNY